MDAKTLEYMGKRVDKARRLRKRIGELNELLTDLGCHKDAYLKFDYQRVGSSSRGHKAICCGDLIGDEAYAMIGPMLVAVVVKTVEVLRDQLADELNQL